MANRWLKQFIKSSDSELCHLDGYVSVGGTGAVASQTFPLGTVTRLDVGAYRLTLQDVWPSVKGVSITPVLKAGLADISVAVVAESVSTTKIVDFTFHTAGTPAELASGNGFHITLVLKNSSLGTGR